MSRQLIGPFHLYVQSCQIATLFIFKVERPNKKKWSLITVNENQRKFFVCSSKDFVDTLVIE